MTISALSQFAAAMRLAANDPDSDYLIESRASRGNMAFTPAAT